MKEFVLHYIWQHKLFVQSCLRTTDGDSIEVIDVGKPNANAGPDFFNAKVKIGNTVWAGNVEIHTLSSDWNKHNHQHDPVYQNVILHVVKKADVPVFLSDGESVPQLELVYPQDIESNYETLLVSSRWVACADRINDVPGIYIQTWMSALLTERLEQKVAEIQTMLLKNNYHWEETFFVLLCKSFGFSVNGDAFVALAKSTPWSIIQKNQNSIFQLEALLFGQSGLLEKVVETDAYIDSLKREYAFQQQKYNLNKCNAKLWRLLRLRPDNFPYIRIAQLVSLLFTQKKLFSNIIKNPDIEILKGLFETVEPSAYWKSHYLLGISSVVKSKRIGINSIHSILINAVVPMVFCYASNKSNQQLKDKALAILDDLPAEKNLIMRKWIENGLNIKSASDSQALIQLFKCYCEDKKCLRCNIGHKVLTISSNQ